MSSASTRWPFEAVETLRPHIPVILYAGFSTKANLAASAGVPVDEILMKPVDQETLA